MIFFDAKPGGVVSLAVPLKETGKIFDSQPCRAVKIHNWTVEDKPNFPYDVPTDGSLNVETSQTEIYYGFGGVLSGQLAAGRETDILPLTNLNELTLQCRNTKTRTVYLTIWL